MSLTRVVPEAVPSETHSSRPCTPSSAEKKSRPPTAAPSEGLLGGVGAGVQDPAEAASDGAGTAANPPRVTAAAAATVAVRRPRARRRRSFARAVRTREAWILALRCRRLMAATSHVSRAGSHLPHRLVPL